jgi:TM2 domain-containing membrane protein YozV
MTFWWIIGVSLILLISLLKFLSKYFDKIVEEFIFNVHKVNQRGVSWEGELRQGIIGLVAIRFFLLTSSYL